MSDTKAIIVGAGLFGSLMGKALRLKGFDTLFIDSGEKRAGSKPAGCLMKPSWMTSLDYKPGMKFLDQNYGVEILKFKVGPLSAECFWVDPVSILKDKDKNVIEDRVIKVEDGKVHTEKKTYSGLVIVAAGFWSKILLPSLPDIQGLCGGSIKFPGKVTPTIKVFAPYKQAVWFNIAKGTVWFGDGTSIVHKNFSEEHKQKTWDRAREWSGLTKDVEDEAKLTVGIRPYLKGEKNGLFARLGDRLFVSTGGAKNGVILAATHAVRLTSGFKK